MWKGERALRRLMQEQRSSHDIRLLNIVQARSRVKLLLVTLRKEDATARRGCTCDNYNDYFLVTGPLHWRCAKVHPELEILGSNARSDQF